MNTMMWLLAGCLVAWIAFSFFRVNARGLIVSLVIGGASGYFGGRVIAPLFASASVETGGFSPFALLVACAIAAIALILSDVVYDRYGV